MRPDVVIDVGNSRIKWGICIDEAVRAICSFPLDAPDTLMERLRTTGLEDRFRRSYVVAGVHPSQREKEAAWLRQIGQYVLVLDDPKSLPLRVLVARPDNVGMDRLFDAVAANSRRTAGVAAVIIDAGSAITVDLVDGSGAFRGGAILPGLRLMAQALHDYTALLPLVEPPSQAPPLPGTATIPAIEAGIFWAAAGGIEAILREYRRHAPRLEVFLTGGDGPLLHAVLPEAKPWPEMTLEGIRLSAEALP